MSTPSSSPFRFLRYLLPVWYADSARRGDTMHACAGVILSISLVRVAVTRRRSRSRAPAAPARHPKQPRVSSQPGCLFKVNLHVYVYVHTTNTTESAGFLVLSVPPSPWIPTFARFSRVPPWSVKTLSNWWFPTNWWKSLPTLFRLSRLCDRVRSFFFYGE